MVRTSLDSGYLPLTALQDAKTCQDTIIFEDLFASFDVMIIINKEAPAQGADCKARDALHECQQTKRPEKHVDGSCQTLRQQLQGWQNTSTGSNTDNQGKNWWLSMDAQSNTDRIPCKESQDITSDSMSDSFLCDWIQLRSTEPGFWSLSSSEASFRANTQTNKALLDESVVSFANIHSCNVCTLHRNLLAIRTSLTLIQIHDYLIHTIPLVWTDRLWCCPGQLSKSHEAEKYRIEGQQEYDNFDNWSNCHHHVQVVYPISPELASEKKDARNHVQDKHGCKKHIARRKYPSRGRRREWQGIGRALARLLKWAWWLGGLKPLTNSAYKARTMNPISYLDLFGSLTLRKINPASGAAVQMSRSKYIKMHSLFGFGKQQSLKWTRRVAHPQFHGDAGGWAYSWWARWPPHQNSHRPA